MKAVLALQWSWSHREAVELSALLADDYLFSCAATDSAGNGFRDRGLTRFDEIEVAQHLFVGGGTSPPASSITLQFDPNLIPQPDGRPGKQDPKYHQEIFTSLVLRIQTDEEQFQITGAARFALVRGDSALIPPELAAGGARPDSTRWYIERWEDETGGPLVAKAGAPARSPVSPNRPLPAKSTTWCEVKALYR